VADLGQDFDDVLRFYTVVETDIMPLLMQATSRIAASDLAPMHENGNNNLRLIDYFPSAISILKTWGGSNQESSASIIVLAHGITPILNKCPCHYFVVVQLGSV
jgi:hypothetical protein